MVEKLRVAHIKDLMDKALDIISEMAELAGQLDGEKDDRRVGAVYFLGPIGDDLVDFLEKCNTRLARTQMLSSLIGSRKLPGPAFRDGPDFNPAKRILDTALPAGVVAEEAEKMLATRARLHLSSGKL